MFTVLPLEEMLAEKSRDSPTLLSDKCPMTRANEGDRI